MTEKPEERVGQRKGLRKDPLFKQFIGGLVAATFFAILLSSIPLLPISGLNMPLIWLYDASLLVSYLVSEGVMIFIVSITSRRAKGTLILYHRYFGLLAAILVGGVVAEAVPDAIVGGITSSVLMAGWYFWSINIIGPVLLYADLLFQIGLLSPEKQKTQLELVQPSQPKQER